MHEPSSTGAPPGAMSRADSRDQHPGQRARVLVVEDDALLASTVCDVLSLEGYATECVETLPQVQALLGETSFDVILADVGIPGAPSSERDYFTLLRAGAPDAAIIAMTGDPKALQLAGPSLGFDELIPKPFEIDELIHCIRAVLDQRARGIAAGE